MQALVRDLVEAFLIAAFYATFWICVLIILAAVWSVLTHPQ